MFSFTESSLEFNSIYNVYDFFNHINYLKYTSDNRRFILRFGDIDRITFGYGQLVKEYSNMIDYPRIRKTGMYLYYTSKERNISIDFFTSSIRDFSKGGGLFGMHSALFISKNFPLTLGIGVVRDLNQFASIKNYNAEWEEWADSLSFNKRGSSSFSLDYTYDLFSSKYIKAYLFGEAVGVIFPDTLYYTRRNVNTVEKNHM